MDSSDEEDVGNPNLTFNKNTNHVPIQINTSNSDSVLINWLRDLEFKVRTMDSRGNDSGRGYDFEGLQSENKKMRRKLEKLQARTDTLESQYNDRFTMLCDRIAFLEEDNKALRNSLETVEKQFASFRQNHETQIPKPQDDLDLEVCGSRF